MLTPRQIDARRKLWARGNLDWKLWNYPQKVIEAKYKEVQKRGSHFLFINCARRSGKTHWDAKKAIETCLSDSGNPKPRVKIGAAFYEDLQEFILPAHEMMLEDIPREIPIRPLPSKRKYQFPKTGGEIKFVGLDLKPNGLRGTYADLVILEEAGFIKRLWYLYSAVCVPMTANRPNAMIVMIGTPPETPDHEWVEFKEKAIKEDCYVELDVEQNDRIDSEERTRLLAECRDESTRQREWYCKVVIDQTRAIIPEWKDKYIKETPRDDFFQFYDCFDAMDLGVVDKTVVLFFWYDFKRATVVVEDELVMNGPEMTTERLKSAGKAKETALWGLKKPYVRMSDNDNLLLLQDLALAGWPFAEVQKTTLEAMVNDLRIWVQAGRVEINPRCKELIGCMRTGIWDLSRKKFERSKVFGHYDALAAMIYGIRAIDPSRNPIPHMYGFTPITHIIPKEKATSPTIQTLRKAFRVNK